MDTEKSCYDFKIKDLILSYRNRCTRFFLVLLALLIKILSNVWWEGITNHNEPKGSL